MKVANFLFSFSEVQKNYSGFSRCYDEEKNEKTPNNDTETYDDG
jgi:hypothetical protein